MTLFPDPGFINTRIDSIEAEKLGFNQGYDEAPYLTKQVGPFEILITGDIYELEKDTHLSLHWKYAPKISGCYGLYDNPTIAQVIKTLEVLEGN